MILVELTAKIDAAGTTRVFYFSTGRFVTGPTDTPAHTAFDEGLINPGSIGVTAFSDGRTGGGTKLEVGDIVIANADGAYDAFLTYGFDGQPVVIRSGMSGAYPAAFSTVLRGTVDTVDASWEEITVRLRPPEQIFERPLQETRYAGTNVLPAGIEGTADDIKGQPKPKVFGTVFNVPAVFVNTAKDCYQVHDGALNAISAVYDKGGVYTAGANYATSALLLAAAPGAGTFITCIAEGLFRLGTAASGLVTADVVQGASSANRTTAQLMKAIALAAGVSGGSISAADVTALDTDAPGEAGLFVGGDMTFQAAMDQVAENAGAYWAFDTDLVLRMGQLKAPTGTPVLTIDTEISIRVERRASKDKPVPVWRVVGHYRPLGVKQDGDIAAAVTAARRAELAAGYRTTAPADDAAVKTQFSQAAELIIEMGLISGTDAATETARRLALHKVRRSIFDVTLPKEHIVGVEIGEVVELELPRFGLDAGVLFRVIGRRIDLDENNATLSLWG